MTDTDKSDINGNDKSKEDSDIQKGALHVKDLSHTEESQLSYFKEECKDIHIACISCLVKFNRSVIHQSDDEFCASKEDQEDKLTQIHIFKCLTNDPQWMKEIKDFQSHFGKSNPKSDGCTCEVRIYEGCECGAMRCDLNHDYPLDHQWYAIEIHENELSLTDKSWMDLLVECIADHDCSEPRKSLMVDFSFNGKELREAVE